MRCQLQFYYYYICNLKELEETEDDSIDNRSFGNIFHDAAHSIYNRLGNRNKQIMRSDIVGLLKEKATIERAVDEAFQKELFKSSEIHSQMAFKESLNGIQLINREVIIHYMRQLLEIDAELAPFSIMGLELPVITQINTPHINTTIGGWIDRLDHVTEKDTGTQCIRVVDYKTGGKKMKSLANVEEVFAQESLDKHSDYYLQTFLYSCIVRTSAELNPRQFPVSPALLFIQHAGTENYNPILTFGEERINDVEKERDRFNELLSATIDDMFNPDIGFVPTEDRQRCRMCPYRLICSKN
jgi:CRISPR/Cas system-associated exonuclease Cas4 (RecB family)